jgi:hypothetical protein
MCAKASKGGDNITLCDRVIRGTLPFRETGSRLRGMSDEATATTTGLCRRERRQTVGGREGSRGGEGYKAGNRGFAPKLEVILTRLSDD